MVDSESNSGTSVCLAFTHNVVKARDVEPIAVGCLACIVQTYLSMVKESQRMLPAGAVVRCRVYSCPKSIGTCAIAAPQSCERVQFKGRSARCSRTR